MSIPENDKIISEGLLNNSIVLEQHLNRGMDFENKGEYDGAVGEYRRYLQLKSNNPWVCAHLAECLGVVGAISESIYWFTEAIKLDPDYSWAYSGRATSYKTDGELPLSLRDYQKALSYLPDNVWLLDQTGEVLYLLNLFEDAIHYFNQSIGLRPDNAWSLAYRGAALAACDEHEAALLDLVQAVNLKPDYGWAHYNLGIVYAFLTRFDDALQQFEIAQQWMSEKTGILKARGQLYMQQAEYEKALCDYKELVRLHPKEAWVYALYARSLEKLNQKEEALKGYQKSVRLGNRNDRIYCEIGILQMNFGNHAAAINSFTKATLFNNVSTTALANRGKVYHDLGKYKKALDDLNQAINLTPEPDPWMYAVRGLVFKDITKTDEAICDFNKALEISPDYKWVLYQRGEVFGLLGRRDEALQDLKKILELDPFYTHAIDAILKLFPLCDEISTAVEVLENILKGRGDDINLRRLLANSYNRAGLYQHAEKHLTAILETNPDDLNALQQRALVRKNDLRPAEALIDINRAIQIDPANFVSYIYQGQIYRNLRHFENAIAAYDRALEIDHMQAWAIGNRGLSHFLLGNVNQALEDYRAAIKLGYENAWIWLRLAELFVFQKETKQVLEALKNVKKFDDKDHTLYYLTALAH
ncbi:MAG: tetratricopeptide repeat protein, partial [Anaerolineae bacterium]|nr:tetratricopeptide repeat protein [Anaerolineae bacterium]